MRAGITPQDHTPNVAPEAVSLICLVSAEKERSARLHEGAVKIPRLETVLSHLTGKSEEKGQLRREEGQNKMALHFITL